MALSPEAIIAMLALFIACVPGLRFFIAYYQSKVKQGQNRIETSGLPSATLNPITLVPFALDSGHNPRARDAIHTYPIIPEIYRIDAVLLNSSHSEVEPTGPSSDNYLPPPLHLLEPLYALLQRYDIVILVSQVGAKVLPVRRVLQGVIPSDEDNPHLTGTEMNITELDEYDQLG